ncbi:MAG: Re/Si-specific NAD(P)(+) transhydrogenase subunit alpha [Micavibrio aeruginosavorus]|uniref:NAD(P) transhydrogenase subunit alpha part 1 n=1 Tax=Micavibrio aeruginosavorus TaxID=349221 RepID=A0A7T5UJ80_9BACT|nr:MAG: Re/Si-specific NAD(P)(+) transhydrogenase subunit alpha [Micavibrio aeruginosavorus]
MTLAILKETAPCERRVAAIPETIKKYVALGCVVNVQQDAGTEASYIDNMYKDAGAVLCASAGDAVKDADIVLCVQAPDNATISTMKKGALLIGILAPYKNADLIESFAGKGINALAMELVPRITRAQAMDVLSSQSNLAGYKAVLDAAEHFTRGFPMMMTAAGTIPPAKIFIMGAGVAGLQAIATARRLGAIVSATDVRMAAREQVQSLGANFVMVEDEETKAAETAGGYAREMSDAYKAKQAALIEETIAKQDIVITTALIPGRPAPRLVTAKMVESMKPGSVIVDLAVEQGGNCELAEAGKVVKKNGVSIIGHMNVPSRIATDASALYARNLLNLINLIVDKETKTLNINWDDDIIKGIALTRDGALIHPQFGGAKAAA